MTNAEVRLMCMLGLPSKHDIPNDPYFNLLGDVTIDEGDVLHLSGNKDDLIYHGPSRIWPEK